MANGQITLFDLPSKEPCRTWSLNPWKTRLLVNYKGLDYKTEWVEYPDIEPRLKAHVPPNETERKAYTIPAVMFPDGTYIMGSRPIAEYIEKNHPEPSVHLESPTLSRLELLMPSLTKNISPVFLNKIPNRILTHASYDYWVTDRTRVVGLPLDEVERKHGGEDAWKAVEPILKEVTLMLKNEPQGPFFLGSQVSYADFVWAAYLVFMQRVGDDVYDEVLRRSGDGEVHAKLLEALGPWLKRDDY